MAAQGIDVTVFTALVARLRDMPLKCAILHKPSPLFKSSCRIWYAAGTFSLKYDGHHCLSPAPQALPHAVGFSSGLSPAPQALPHALAAFNCLKKRFFNIIIAFEGCMTNLLILLSTTKLDHLFLTDKKLYLCQIVTFFSLLLIDKRLPTQKNCPNLHTPNL